MNEKYLVGMAGIVSLHKLHVVVFDQLDVAIQHYSKTICMYFAPWP